MSEPQSNPGTGQLKLRREQSQTFLGGTMDHGPVYVGLCGFAPLGRLTGLVSCWVYDVYLLGFVALSGFVRSLRSSSLVVPLSG